MNKNKSIYFTIIVTCLMTAGCSLKEQTSVETDAWHDFLCNIKDLKLRDNRPFVSPQTYHYESYAFGRDYYNFYSCGILCEFDEQTSIFDINKPSKSSFNAEYSNGPTYNRYQSRSGVSNGEKLIYEHGYNDGVGENHETLYSYALANNTFRYDLDFDYASFTKIKEFINLYKSESEGRNKTDIIEDETDKYYFDVYPESKLISCFKQNKESPIYHIRTNLFFDSIRDENITEWFVARITCELSVFNSRVFCGSAYTQIVSFATAGSFIASTDEFKINQNASLIPEERSNEFFNQDINAFVSCKEMCEANHL